ncbi:MAG: ATP-binding protein [Verrucomicrobiales bacterium]|nr:ATP-binding protein [Verrucomicrobiales bacterium]
MTSIQRRLSLWFLGSLALLWILAATGVYLAVRNSLITSIDAELAVDARGVRFAVKGNDTGERNIPGNRRLRSILPAFDDPEGNKYYQLWDDDGTISARSPSLGDREFDFPGRMATTAATFHSTKLEKAGEVRALLLMTPPGGKGKGTGTGFKGKGKPKTEVRVTSPAVITLIAKDMDTVTETLRSLAGGLALVGALLLGGAVFLVRLGVQQSLAPLRRLARETRNVDASSLHERFDDGGAPLELQPVYSHLNDLIARLESSFERERQFNADLAHEMRTPVAELRMMNEVALKWEDQAGEATHQSSLDIAKQLESIIDTLLTLARCESGELSPTQESVSITTLVNEVWSIHRRMADTRQLQVELPSTNIEYSVATDPRLFRHIVSNLISNAVAYAPEKSWIAIRSSPGNLSVSNLAPELKLEDLEHLCQRYWRKDASRSGGAHTGLGLSLAQACAELCDMTLEPALEQGVLTMTVQFPTE